MIQPRFLTTLRFDGAVLRRVVALGLVLMLTPAPQLVAQISGIGSGQPGTPMALHIVILDGENALNNIRQRTAREPIVQVEDENHKPVAGAAVLFTIRHGKSGAGGTFSGAASISVVTGATGQAIATGFIPNNLKGQFSIQVTATSGPLTTSAIITQTNVIGPAGTSNTPTTNTGATVPPPSPTMAIAHHFLFTKQFWFVAGGVAAAGAVVATSVVLSNNSGATITAGGGTVKP